MSGPVLIFGCGYLGRRVAKSWTASGRSVVALTRHNGDELHTLGITPITGDVLEPATLVNLPEASAVLYAVGFDRTTGRTMQEIYVQGLINALRAIRCAGPLIYISSTSVYGQTDGEWVTEASRTEPLEESGKVVLEAEQRLRELRPDAMILRFAGIYGPNRILRRQALLNGDPFVGDADKWLNLIHVDDGASAIRCAEANGRAGEVYLISDGEPVRRRDFYTYSAEVLGAPPAKFEKPESVRIEANRRVSNDRAVRELRFVPQYPNYRVGLPASVV